MRVKVYKICKCCGRPVLYWLWTHDEAELARRLNEHDVKIAEPTTSTT